MLEPTFATQYLNQDSARESKATSRQSCITELSLRAVASKSFAGKVIVG